METGSVINQDKIISLIGRGGMGEVFLPEFQEVDTDVALLKVGTLVAPLGDDPRFRYLPKRMNLAD